MHTSLLRLTMVIMVLGLFSATALAQSEPCPQLGNVAMSGQVGTTTGYHGIDFGAAFYRRQAVQGSVAVSADLGKCWSVQVGTWGQVAAKERGPNGAREWDVDIKFTRILDGGTKLDLYAGGYNVDGLSVRKYSATVSRSYPMWLPGKKRPVNLVASNEFAVYHTSRSGVAPGGVMNKFRLGTSVPLGKRFTMGGGLAASVDNGPFRLGGPASMFFADGNVSFAVNDRLSVVGSALHTNPLIGDTVRRPLNSGKVGLAFRIY